MNLELYENETINVKSDNDCGQLYIDLEGKIQFHSYK